MALMIRSSASDRAAQSPVVFQCQQHAAFLGQRQAGFETFDDPAKGFFVRAAWRSRLNASVLHQLVKLLIVPQRPVLTRIVGIPSA